MGRQIALRPSLLAKWISENNYLRHSGLVEVIADLTADNEPLIADIVSKSNLALAEFDVRYIPESFDPFNEVEWSSTALEAEKLWKPLSEMLAKGPRNPKEIDEIKSSLAEETRASNQVVPAAAKDFDSMERRLVSLHIALTEAMRNGDALPADAKRVAVIAMLKGYFRMLQIGTTLSSALANKPYVRWHGIAFLNQVNDTEKDDEKRTVKVMVALLRAVSLKAAEEIGSKKLGEAFKEFASSGQLTGYMGVLNFSCLIRAKPHDWFRSASEAIAKMGRNTFYLSSVLDLSYVQFNDEVNTTADRENLKRLIAVIAAKRQLNKQNPGMKDLNQFVQRLEERNAFADPKSADPEKGSL